MSAEIYLSILSRQEKHIVYDVCQARWFRGFSVELRVLESESKAWVCGYSCCVAPFCRTDCSHSASPPNQETTCSMTRCERGDLDKMITGSLLKGPITQQPYYNMNTGTWFDNRIVASL